MKQAIWLLRADLRIANNPTLEAALAWRERTSGTLRAIYLPMALDPVSLDEFPEPIARLSNARKNYTTACLDSLRQGLAALHISMLEVHEDLPTWLENHAIDSLFFTYGAAFDERALEARVLATDVTCYGFYSRTLQSASQVLQSPLPSTYTPYRKKTEEHLGDRPFPNIRPFEGRAQLQNAFSPIESEARAHLYAYVSHQGPARHYKSRRNGLLRVQDSTKLSAYLSMGLLHPQEVWNRCLEIEAAVGGCEEVYWIRFELLWREYFQWVAYEAGAKLFRREGLKEPLKPLSVAGSPTAFALWTQGQTGDALVDAAMRELKETGFQSNRARQNAASYWIHDLKQPWRVGAAYFEAMLLDYDAASNWGNWAYIAGVGNDPRPFRKFNTEKQAAQYDPDGSYQRTWAG